MSLLTAVKCAHCGQYREVDAEGRIGQREAQVQAQTGFRRLRIGWECSSCWQRFRRDHDWRCRCSTCDQASRATVRLDYYKAAMIQQHRRAAKRRAERESVRLA